MEMTEKLQPWYRQFWPWFLMAFPATAVVAGFITLRLAVNSDDGLVEDDYYKQGMAINRTLTRESAAAAAHLAGRLHLANGEASLRLTGALATWPQQLRLRILHPTRAGMDEVVDLIHQGNGIYAGRCRVPAIGKWDLILEDHQKTWRLMGTWHAEHADADLAAMAQ